MGLTISSVLTRLFGKKQMRILMGKYVSVVVLVEWQENKYEFCEDCYWHSGVMLGQDKLCLLFACYTEVCVCVCVLQVRLGIKLKPICSFMVNGSSGLFTLVKHKRSHV